MVPLFGVGEVLGSLIHFLMPRERIVPWSRAASITNTHSIVLHYHEQSKICPSCVWSSNPDHNVAPTALRYCWPKGIVGCEQPQFFDAWMWAITSRSTSSMARDAAMTVVRTTGGNGTSDSVEAGSQFDWNCLSRRIQNSQSSMLNSFWVGMRQTGP